MTKASISLKIYFCFVRKHWSIEFSRLLSLKKYWRFKSVLCFKNMVIACCLIEKTTSNLSFQITALVFIEQCGWTLLYYSFIGISIAQKQCYMWNQYTLMFDAISNILDYTICLSWLRCFFHSFRTGFTLFCQFKYILTHYFRIPYLFFKKHKKYVPFLQLSIYHRTPFIAGVILKWHHSCQLKY